MRFKALIFLNLFFIRVWLIYRVESISAVQHSNRVIHTYISFSHSIFHCGLSQEAGYSSLGYLRKEGE